MRRWFLRGALAVIASAALSACSDTPISPNGRLNPKIQADVNPTNRPEVVISAIYGAGGNANATLRNDYIELHNTTDHAVNISNWRIYYGASGSTSVFGNSHTIPNNTSIPAGGYFLIQEASGGSNGALLPTADLIASPAINMAAGAGKVILASGAITGAGLVCPNEAAIVDAVSFGSTACSNSNAWLSGTPAPSVSNAAVRLEDGCKWTPDPASDFAAQAATTSVRNSATAPHSCGGVVVIVNTVTVTPADQVVQVGVAPLQYQAAESNVNGPVNTSFTWNSTNQAVATVVGGPNGTATVTVHAAGTTQIEATASDNVVGKTSLTVQAAPPPLSAIRFSELHYDNAGTDVGESIEVEGPAGADVTGWRVLLYNGNGGVVYGTNPLSGQFANRCNGRGVMVVEYPVSNSIQNGPDAIALVDANNQVVEFLSYGGAVTATADAAAGMTATPMGVAENNNLDNGSLKRNAAGVWQAQSAPASFGKCNENDVAPPAPAALVITELMGNPDPTDDAAGEWFEVFNPTNAPVSLNQWRIVSLETGVVVPHAIAANVVVPAKGFIVLGNNSNSALNGGITEAYQYSGITFSNSTTTDYVELQDQFGQSADRVNYNGLLPVAGVARAVIDPSLDNLLINGPNWEDVGAGTPGTGDYSERGPVATLTLIANPAYVGANGGTRQLTYSAKDAQDRTVRTVLTWTSLNTNIATVDQNTGLVTGVNPGDVTIQATSSNGVTSSVVVHVMAPGTPAYVLVSIDSNKLPAGYQRQAFISGIRDANDQPVPGLQVITWSSDDESIATVEQRGYVTGVAAGTVKIRVTTANGATGFVTMNILPHSVPTSAVYRNPFEFGQPVDGNPLDDYMIEHPQFTSSYSSARGGPNYVAWNLNFTQFGNAPRCDCFSTDPDAPAPIVEDANYKNGGYDRGHMVQSESRTTTDQENAATFLLTNILPQAANNNQGPWLKFENYLNDLARGAQHKEIYIVAGGQYAANPPFLKDSARVAIPDYTWKVAVIVGSGKGLSDVHSEADLQVIAIRIPNLVSTAPEKAADWEPFKVTVDEIEAATGYDFLSALPDNIEIAVESNTHAPVAAVDGPYTATAHTTVNMSAAASSDADAGQTLTYAWNFGDGTTGTGATATHAYNKKGTFTVTVTVTDPLGITSTASTTATISDASAAVITPTVTGTPGNNGWYTSDVAISWSVVDDESGIASSTGCSDASVVADTDNAAFTCEAVNGEGMSSSQNVNVKRDASAPVVTYTGNLGSYTVADNISITCNASDVGPSGVATTTCANVSGAAYTFALGNNSFSANAVDNAGNTGNGSTSFTVTVGTESLTSLVVRFSTKQGTTNSLSAKLAEIQDAIAAGNANAKAGKVGAFVNEVEAQRGKALSSEQADLLIRLVNSL